MRLPRGLWRRCRITARAALVGARRASWPATKYSYEAYLERTRQACRRSSTPAGRLGGAGLRKDVA